MDQSAIQILEYAPAHQPWFEKFNRQWIEKFFAMEAPDFQILQHPDEHILKDGGFILMAAFDNELAGTVAMKRTAPEVFELTKMAVDEKFRSRKIGLALAGAAVEKARARGAKRIFLYSNTALVPAVALYRKLGFKEIPVDGPYRRTNIKMELNLL